MSIRFYFVRNAAIAKAERVLRNGQWWWVAPSTTLPGGGVLNGSKGSLYYPPKQVERSTSEWDRVPLTIYHPTGPQGQHISANEAPDQQIGRVANSLYDGKLRHQLWFNEQATAKADRRFGTNILSRLRQGMPIELSTGLYTENVESKGVNKQGKTFDYMALNYRPDHIAILPDQIGACSVNDGCGVLVNQGQGDSTAHIKGNPHTMAELVDPHSRKDILVENPAVSEAQRRYLNATFGHDWVKEHSFDNKGKLPETVDNDEECHIHNWSDAAREASAEARRASQSAKDKPSHRKAATLHEKATQLNAMAGRWDTAKEHRAAFDSHMKASSTTRNSRRELVANAADPLYQAIYNATTDYLLGIGDLRGKTGTDIAQPRHPATQRFQGKVSTAAERGHRQTGFERPEDELHEDDAAAMIVGPDGGRTGKSKDGRQLSDIPEQDEDMEEMLYTGDEDDHIIGFDGLGTKRGNKVLSRTANADSKKMAMKASSAAHTASAEAHQTDSAEDHLAAVQAHKKAAGKQFEAGNTPAAQLHMTLANDHDGAAQQSKMSANEKRCKECGGKVDSDGECEECGEITENAQQQARGNRTMNKTRQWLQSLAANCSCERTKQQIQSVLTANMPAGGAFTGAKQSGYSPSQAAAMAGKLEGSYTPGDEGSGGHGHETLAATKASAHAEKAGTAGAHKKAAAAHKDAAEHHKDEGNSEMAKGHSAKAASHMRQAKKITGNQAAINHLVASGVLPLEQANAAFVTLNAKPDSNFSDVAPDEDDTTEDSDKEDEVNDTFDAAGKAKKGITGKTPSSTMNALSDEDRAVLDYGRAALRRDKLQVVNQLVANVGDSTQRQAMGTKLMRKPISELREMLVLMPQPTANRNGVSREDEFSFVDNGRQPASYLGANSFDGSMVGNTAVMTDNLLEVPTLNSVLDEEDRLPNL